MIHTIQSTDFRNNFKEALSQVKKTKKPLIITERGIPTSVLVSIDEYEDYLDEKNASFVASLKKSKKEAKLGRVLAFSDVFGNI